MLKVTPSGVGLHRQEDLPELVAAPEKHLGLNRIRPLEGPIPDGPDLRLLQHGQHLPDEPGDHGTPLLEGARAESDPCHLDALAGELVEIEFTARPAHPAKADNPSQDRGGGVLLQGRTAEDVDHDVGTPAAGG